MGAFDEGYEGLGMDLKYEKPAGGEKHDELTLSTPLDENENETTMSSDNSICSSKKDPETDPPHVFKRAKLDQQCST
jgi:hypothetical protein